MMSWYRIALFTGGLLAAMGGYSAQADVPDEKGITLQSTRVIYNEKTAPKGMTFTVTNNTDSLYLLKSWVDVWGAKEVVSDETAMDATRPSPVITSQTAPFIVLPPLVRFEAGESTTLRIRATQHTLPTDRESVFAFQMALIPNQRPPEATEDNANKVSESALFTLGIQNTLKLFYRPAGLPDDSTEDVAKALTFHVQDNAVVVTNPTPFYATFGSLSIGGVDVNQETLFEMVPPLGQQHYPFSTNIKGGSVNWTLITDEGATTEPLSRSLDTSK